MPGNCPSPPRKPNGRLVGRLVLQSGLALLAVKHFEDFVSSYRLRPENISRVIGLFVKTAGGVTVENWAAESHVVIAAAVDADGHVTASHHHFELAVARLTEQRDALRMAVATAIVVQLLIDFGNPIGMEQSLVDGPNNVLLIFAVEIAVDRRLGDVPVIADPRGEQTALRIDIVPIEGDDVPLLGLERIVQLFH